MSLALLVIAAVCFSVGGLLMKLSNGATRLYPTMGFLLLFTAGAILQAIGMRKLDLGAAYIAVLGLEAVITLGFSLFLLREGYSTGRVVAVVLIIGGVILLRRA